MFKLLNFTKQCEWLKSLGYFIPGEGERVSHTKGKKKVIALLISANY